MASPVIVSNPLVYFFLIILLFPSKFMQLCIEEERKALLSVRAGIPDVNKKLRPWRGYDCCSWEGVGCNNITGHVTILDLSADYGGAPAEVHPSLFDLKHLIELDLSYNNFHGAPLPVLIGSLTMLERLHLSYTSFSGGIPYQLGNLSHLRYLDLSYAAFSGKIPYQLGNLSNLLSLDLSYNSISEEIPESIGNLKNLQVLDMPGNKIVGAIPDALGSLCNLSEINLSNNSITGELDYFFEQLSRCRSKSRSTVLELSFNQLKGSVPTSLAKLSTLLQLSLSSNGLVGVLTDAHFANLTSLDTLDLSQNNLSVEVSEGWLPPFQATEIYMSSCNLGPRFPSWLRNQTKFITLDMSNNIISGALLDWFWHSLRYFSPGNIYLSYNNFEGMLPNIQIKAALLDLSHNFFSGPIPESLVTPCFIVSNNRLNGSIPSSICAANVQILDFGHNGLSGALPDCWGNSSTLSFIDVSNNKLSGGIPKTFKFAATLQSLQLSNNSLSGTIPSTLQHCRELKVIDFSRNDLSGAIPSWIERRLLSLRALSLRSNKFAGAIPLRLLSIPSLQVLDLAHNLLSGSLPPYFANFTPNIIFADFLMGNIILIAKDLTLDFTLSTRVSSIDLSNNNLSGMIPRELTNLSDLHFLNLSSNNFSGNIPDNIKLMSQLESLDLSNNQLSGGIPPSISSLNFLTILNLSYNNLVGEIPAGSQLQTFTNLSYIGNPKLCGKPLSSKCPGDNPTIDNGITKEEDMHEDDEHGRKWYFIGFAPGFVFGFWGFMAAVMIKKSIRIKYILLIDKICTCFT
ncbi:receptor-like protein EIX2 [Zingiber officinale]|uniref:Leucine-rich repeat-containing N-terminal plant-type domain-containing protein n=1 Tax=Zingiber officinale TaxID=94328 RepID=A0A8J5LQX7_ZINOF|nr:receptor-like protein EIX2 [Zingiber officinale]KAG6530480.1 hypothetical protein ZIOFF_012719 [Zingiber officinale]